MKEEKEKPHGPGITFYLRPIANGFIAQASISVPFGKTRTTGETHVETPEHWLHNFITPIVESADQTFEELLKEMGGNVQKPNA